MKKIAPVEKFIKDHMNKMAEEALWKMAALTYVREVQEPRRREGVLSPDVSGLPPPQTHHCRLALLSTRLRLHF